MKSFEETMDILAASSIIRDMTKRYTNDLLIKGWIVRKPKFFKHDKFNTESCTFVIYQVSNYRGVITMQSFSCMTFNKDMIDQLKKQDKVFMCNIRGSIRYSKSIKGNYIQAEEIETLFEFDEDLTEEWQRKGE